MLTDLHALARAVAEILHDDSEAFPVGARVHPHRYPDGDPVVRVAVSGWPPIGPPRRSVKDVCCCLMRN